MTIEEKAKAYDEALEKAKDCLKDGTITSTAIDYIEIIFPELAESEDEKIRKAISQCVEDMRGQFEKLYSVHHKDAIAWLEKQGDKDKLIKELGEYKVKYTQEVLERHLNNMSNKDDERLKNTTIAFLKDYADKGYENAVECIDWLEKQGEQKPVNDTDEDIVEAVKDTSILDMVEPKFKVGDWILYSGDHYEGVRHITKIDENGYYIERNGLPHGIIPFNHEICMRLWTIQDAKDGDVLCVKYGNDEMPFIFTGKQDDVAYCALNSFGEFVLSIAEWLLKTSVFPATKEQRELLFKKMKEAGYEWDAEKKELKKVWQKLTELAKGEDYGKCWKPSIDVDTMVEEYVKQYAYIDMRSCDSIRKVYREGILNILDKINK